MIPASSSMRVLAGTSLGALHSANPQKMRCVIRGHRFSLPCLVIMSTWSVRWAAGGRLTCLLLEEIVEGAARVVRTP